MLQRQRILCALDLSEYAEIVLEHALDQAARAEAPELHFLTVVDRSAACELTKQRLAGLVIPAFEGLDCTLWTVRLHVRVGKPADEITVLADEIHAHLVVLGRFGTHHPHRRLGSVASHVIDRVNSPTLIVGLTATSEEAVAQCPACVEVRAASGGERWFCDEHRAPERVRLTTLVSPGTLSSGGGLMW